MAAKCRPFCSTSMSWQGNSNLAKVKYTQNHTQNRFIPFQMKGVDVIITGDIYITFSINHWGGISFHMEDIWTCVLNLDML